MSSAPPSLATPSTARTATRPSSSTLTSALRPTCRCALCGEGTGGRARAFSPAPLAPSASPPPPRPLLPSPCPHRPHQEELKTKRSLRAFKDPRVHVCLYCLAPTITSLKSLDLVVMKRLQDRVNIVPVITKADTITQAEMGEFKALVSWLPLPVGAAVSALRTRQRLTPEPFFHSPSFARSLPTMASRSSSPRRSM